MHRITLWTGICMSCLVMAVACGDQGPAEKAGAKVDQAVESIDESIEKGMKDLGEAELLEDVDQALDEVGHAIADAVEKDGSGAKEGEEKAEG